MSSAETRYSSHDADEVREVQHQKVRDVLRQAEIDVCELMLDGREKSLVKTKLEEAMFWANAGIARQGRS